MPVESQSTAQKRPDKRKDPGSSAAVSRMLPHAVAAGEQPSPGRAQELSPKTHSSTAIRARLHGLVKQHPQLAPVVAALPRSLTPTAKFLKACAACEAPDDVRSLLLRVLFEEPHAYGEPDRRYQVDEAIFNRFVAYLHNHPDEPFGALQSSFGHDDLPAFLALALVGSRVNPTMFFRQAITRPYQRARAGQNPYPGRPVDISAEQAAALKPLFRQALLEESQAVSLVDAAATQAAAAHCFDSGEPVLDRRNALQFAAVYVANSDRNRQLQAKVPTQVSRVFGIKRLSAAELAMACELAGLVAGDLVVLPDAVPSNLRDCYDFLHRLHETRDFEDTRRLCDQLFNHYLLTDDKVLAIHAEHQGVIRRGRYGTGLYFNADRLLEQRQFERFAALFKRIDMVALKQRVLRHFTDQDPLFGEALAPILDDEDWRGEGLWPRSVANTLYYVWTLRNAHGVRSPTLPTMAQYLMGRSDEPGPHRRRRNLGAQRRVEQGSSGVSPLPQLDALMARLPGADLASS